MRLKEYGAEPQFCPRCGEMISDVGTGEWSCTGCGLVTTQPSSRGADGVIRLSGVFIREDVQYFLRAVDVGDEARFRTWTTERKSWMPVTEVFSGEEMTMESSRGAKYTVFAYTQLGPLEDGPGVKRTDGEHFDGLGGLEELEVKLK